MTSKILIKCIGTLQEPWHKQAIHMYTQRYRPFGKLEIIELPEGHKGSAKPNLIQTLQTEADSLFNKIDSDSFIIALDQTGTQLTSQDLANLIKGSHPSLVIGNRSLVILIGGSWGLDKNVLKKANLVLSLGKITLPHSLARIILLEQLYRAQMINSGRKYHK